MGGGCRAETGGRGLGFSCRFVAGAGGKRGPERRGGSWGMRGVVVDGGGEDHGSILEVEICIC